MPELCSVKIWYYKKVCNVEYDKSYGLRCKVLSVYSVNTYIHLQYTTPDAHQITSYLVLSSCPLCFSPSCTIRIYDEHKFCRIVVRQDLWLQEPVHHILATLATFWMLGLPASSGFILRHNTPFSAGATPPRIQTLRHAEAIKTH